MPSRTSRTKPSASGDAFALRKLQRDAGDGVLGLQGQDKESLVLELVAQTFLVLGDVDAFDDLPVWRCSRQRNSIDLP